MNKKIYNAIKQRILSLEYEPGQNLIQKKIAAEWGVSQTPIREIFLRLEWEGLVTIVPRIGIQVTKIDFKELKEVYHSRILIESELVKRATANISEDDLKKMEALLGECKKIKGDNTRQRLVELDKQFREILFKAANCRTLQQLSEILYNQTLRVWHLTFDTSDETSEVIMESNEIEKTINSLKVGDPDSAKTLRKEIIITWVERLNKYFTRF